MLSTEGVQTHDRDLLTLLLFLCLSFLSLTLNFLRCPTSIDVVVVVENVYRKNVNFERYDYSFTLYGETFSNFEAYFVLERLPRNQVFKRSLFHLYSGVSKALVLALPFLIKILFKHPILPINVEIKSELFSKINSSNPVEG